MDEIEQVLREERVGRIGCHAEGRTYVVPIAYVYDGGDVLARSSDGLKIRTMRANPAVCFEVERVEDLARWCTVIAAGTFEELAGAEEDRAARLLFDRLGSSAAPPAQAGRTILFRVRLDEKTGRREP